MISENKINVDILKEEKEEKIPENYCEYIVHCSTLLNFRFACETTAAVHPKDFPFEYPEKKFALNYLTQWAKIRKKIAI